MAASNESAKRALDLADRTISVSAGERAITYGLLAVAEAIEDLAGRLPEPGPVDIGLALDRIGGDIARLAR